MPTRLNRWLAAATELSRRGADEAIAAGRVTVNGQPAVLGAQVTDGDKVALDGQPLTQRPPRYIMFNKPIGYVCSRKQQGSAPTIYAILPEDLRTLNSIGRLDKDSSGLLLLTDDGDLAEKLAHPSQEKEKHYQVELDKPLTAESKKALEKGVILDDGASHIKLQGSGQNWNVIIHEGRNRQIRRTFLALGYTVTGLHRSQFGPYMLGDLEPGKTAPFNPEGA